MEPGDLVWCVFHIYFLPQQGIIVNVMKDMDIFYVVLIEDEEYILGCEEVFLKESEALQYQINVLKQNNQTPIR